MVERPGRWVNAGSIGIELWVLRGTPEPDVEAADARLDRSVPAWARYDVGAGITASGQHARRMG